MSSRDMLTALRPTHRDAIARNLWLRLDAEFIVGEWAGTRHVLAMPAEDVSLARPTASGTFRVLDAQWLPHDQAVSGRVDRFPRWTPRVTAPEE